MKKLLILTIFMLALTFSARSQKFEITPQYGYQLGAKYNYYGGYLKLEDSDQYGITFSLNPNDNISFEFMWAQQNSSVSIKDYINPIQTTLTDVRVDHFQFGAAYMFGYNEFRPFAGLSAGWSTFDPERKLYDVSSYFTMGLTGGLKYFFSDRIGIRIQTQLLMPVGWGGVYIGPGGAGVTAGGSILQLNFSGGLIIGLGD